jgi:UDP-N-acetyl-D-galactosamine dehydrogenase
MQKIAIIGLGYVGLPLAIEFGKKYPTVGFDIDQRRILELRGGLDRTHEMSAANIAEASRLSFTFEPSAIASCNIYIVTVPTPIDANKKPDLSFLLHASELIGQVLKKEDIVIYESTVYPGCTEEDCVPVLEKTSGLIFNKDFFVGYSPERIVPGDKSRPITSICKITSGSTASIAQKIDNLYASIISAGTYLAPSIKVAEAAKVIENCQRDLNISFVNELALIFDRMGIDTHDVIEAAGTKFNFIKYKPGLVGGHCISVDPYYLTSKAEQLGYSPQVIHSGRRINDYMATFIANKVVKLLIQKQTPVQGARVLVLGITFKENCGDLRNSKVIDLIHELKEFGCVVACYDPIANPEEVNVEYQIELIPELGDGYEAIVHAVAHEAFKGLPYKDLLAKNGVVYDVKATLDRGSVDGRL